MKGLIITIGILVFVLLVLIRAICKQQDRIDDLKYKNSGLQTRVEEQEKRITTLKIWLDAYEETAQKTKKRASDSQRSKKKSDTTKK